MKNTHLNWRRRSNTLYAQSMRGRWDGDSFGNEWCCGYAIHQDEIGWVLYEDDGSGNGDLLGEFPTIWEAALAANAHDVDPAKAIDRWFPEPA